MNVEHRLTVHVIEKSFTGLGHRYDHANYYDIDSTSSFYDLGNPIEPYEYNNILRLVLSEPSSDLIHPSFLVPKCEFIKEFEINISTYVVENLFLIAVSSFVGENYLSHEVLNTQKYEVEGTKDWD